MQAPSDAEPGGGECHSIGGASGAKYWGGWVSALPFAGASGTMELG